MKRIILSSEDLTYGTWLLDRNNELMPVSLHVPSTTWISRGLDYLAPTDGEFLLKHEYIDAAELKSIVYQNFVEYLQTNNIVEYSISDVVAFTKYAELRYAPVARQIAMSIEPGNVDSLIQKIADLPDFSQLNKRWYKFLQNNFAKVSKFGGVVEVRIASDKFNWNDTIIDMILDNSDKQFDRCRINVLKETSAGYKVYYQNAPISDLLINDAVIASTSTRTVQRKIINNQPVYTID